MFGVLTLATGGLFKNPFVDASSPISPEMSLSLILNPNTTLESIYTKLNNSAGIDIQSIQGEVFIGGKSQPISATIENDDTVGNTKGTRAMDEYRKQEDNFLALLSKIETEGLPASLESQREVLKPLLDEFSAKEVSETKTQALRKPSQITSISLMGSKIAVANTRNLLTTVTKEATELDLAELEAMSKKTQEIIAVKQEEIKNLPKEEQQKVITETVQSLVSENLTPVQKQEMTNQPKLEMSEEELKKIDSFVQTAPNGDRFLLSSANLNQETTSLVNKKLNEHNKLPEATKDGRAIAESILSEASTNINQEISLSNIFEPVQAKANNCWLPTFRFTDWWGVSFRLSGCLITNAFAVGGVAGVLNWNVLWKIAIKIASFATFGAGAIVTWFGIQAIMVLRAKDICGYANLYITWFVPASWSRCG